MKDTANLKTFSDRLIWARQQKNMTQQDLADAIGVGQSTISALESGESKSSRKTTAIGHVLGVNPHWLSSGRGDPYYRTGEGSGIVTVTYSLQRLDAWETEFMNLLRPLDQERKNTLMSMARMMHPQLPEGNGEDSST